MRPSMLRDIKVTRIMPQKKMSAFVVPRVGFGVQYWLQRHWGQSFFQVLRIVGEDKEGMVSCCESSSHFPCWQADGMF